MSRLPILSNLSTDKKLSSLPMHLKFIPGSLKKVESNKNSFRSKNDNIIKFKLK